MKILIVEDCFISRMLMTEFLKGYGTCHIAINGLEAVDAVALALKAGKPYDLVFMDMQMPMMNGDAALEAIRNLESDADAKTKVKVIMTTAEEATEAILKKFAKLHCDGFISKPINREKLREQFKALKLVE